MSAFGDLIPHRSIKGMMIHKLAKPILMNAFSYMDGVMADVCVDKVKNNSWNNEAIKMLYEIMTDLIADDEICRLPDGQFDPIRQMWMNARNAGCTILDEDTHYAMRVMNMFDQIAERWPKLKKEQGDKQWIMDWERISLGLQQKKEVEAAGGTVMTPLSVMEQRGILKETPEGTLVIDNDRK